MKRLMIAFGLFVMLVCAARAADTNFAGTWEFDKDKSTAPGRGGSPTSWTVTQDAKTVTVESKSTGQNGQERVTKTTYNLDGSETTTEVTRGQMTGKNTTKAKWGEGNKTLEATTVFAGKRNDQDVTNTTKEKWELSADGKVLTVARTREGGGGGGGGESKLVFNKK
jgi:hypothetical protein